MSAVASCSKTATAITLFVRHFLLLTLITVITSANRRRLCFRCGLFVCLFVSLSIGLLGNLGMDFDEIFCRGRAWLKDQVIQFLWRSRSRFRSGSPKSGSSGLLKKLCHAVFGRGFFSVSASSC